MLADRPAQVLLVEDEVHLAAGIAENLIAEGYAVVVVNDGEAALVQLQQQPFDLIILDVMLPKLNGYAVCEAIRNGQTINTLVPILFLSAKNAASERILGLRLGGDDYLGKPFVLRELLLRAAALLRRQQISTSAPSETSPVGDAQVLSINGFVITVEDGLVHSVSPAVATIGKYEGLLLQLLWAHRNTVVERETMVTQVWGEEVRPSTRFVRKCIGALQRKLQLVAGNPCRVEEVAGIGWKIVCIDDDQ